MAKTIARKGKKEEIVVSHKKYTCFKCYESFTEIQFYLSNSDFYYKVPVCKECLYKIFETRLSQNGSISKTMIGMCSEMNTFFSNSLLDSCIDDVNSKNGEKVAVFKYYMRQVNSQAPYRGLTFKDSEIPNNLFGVSSNLDSSNMLSLDENKIKWGYNYTPEDYAYLNAKYDEWCITSPHDLISDITGIRDICKQELYLSKNPDDAKATKTKYDLIKACGLDGKSLRNEEKGRDNVLEMELGKWIEEIEHTEPCDLWDDKKKYVDMSGRDEYYKNQYIRPMRNICMGKKDFPKVR